jgi:DNA-binding Xre family transcriptional regulator
MEASLTQIENNGRYAPKEIVGTYHNKHGDERIVHKPKGRALRVLKEMNTPVLRMNRVSAELSGKLIRERRLAKGFTLEDLANRAGLKSQTPKEYMWSLENCVRGQGMRMGTLYAIARALGCEVSDIIPSVAEVEKAAVVFDVTVIRAE